MSIFMFTVVCIQHNERSSQFFAPPVSFVSQLINVLLLVDSLLAERLKCKWGTQCGFFGCLSSSCMMGSSPGSQSSTLCDSLFLWQPQTGKRRKKKQAVLRHLQEVVVKMLKNIFVTPPGVCFFSPSFFLFHCAYPAMGLHSECDYDRAVSLTLNVQRLNQIS